MAKLKDRTKQVPNGLKFLQPETGWQPIPWSSFDSICDQLVAHRKGNMWLALKNNWNLTRPAVDREVDAYNSALCEVHGYHDFIVAGESPIPKTSRLSQMVPEENVAAGIKPKTAGGTIRLFIDWLGNGMKPVDKQLAEQRALTCSRCPENQLGDFWTRMKGLAAEEIRTMIGMKNDLQLSTTLDDKLHSCNACECWNPLKVWCPLQHVLDNTDEKTMKAFHPDCWILREKKQLKK